MPNTPPQIRLPNDPARRPAARAPRSRPDRLERSGGSWVRFADRRSPRMPGFLAVSGERKRGRMKLKPNASSEMSGKRRAPCAEEDGVGRKFIDCREYP